VLASVVATFAIVIAGAAVAQPATDAVYRFYNRESGTHFYTVSVTERDQVIAAFPQFAYEGAVFAAYAQPTAGAVPVFRFYNTKTGTHFYTISSSERDGIIAYYPAFAYEGAAYYAMASDGADGRIEHSEVRLGEVALMIASFDAAYTIPPLVGRSTGGALYLLVDDVSDLYQRALAAGGTSVFAPEQTAWGTWRARVLDPEGWEWNFGTYEPGQSWT
jgi:uncharacterized glyoxalase superfamily protein PhnB